MELNIFTVEDRERFKNGGRIKIHADHWKTSTLFYKEEEKEERLHCVWVRNEPIETQSWKAYEQCWGSLARLENLTSIRKWEFVRENYEPKYIRFELEDE